MGLILDEAESQRSNLERLQSQRNEFRIVVSPSEKEDGGVGEFAKLNDILKAPNSINVQNQSANLLSVNAA